MSVEFLKAYSDLGDYPEDLGTIVHTTGWSAEHKYQYNTTIIEISEEEAERLSQEWVISSCDCKAGTYAIHASRSGSPFTDYEYNDPDIEEVEIYYENVPVLKWKSKE